MQPGNLANGTKKSIKEGDKDVVIQFSTRQSRNTYGTSILFSINMQDPVPSEPNDLVRDISKMSVVTQQVYKEVCKMFQERPIWTLYSLQAHMREKPTHLSAILANVAFYYTTGPWRNCFVRYGYDPRTEFKSRFYQMIDYRVRQGVGFKFELKRKRTSAVSRRVKVQQKADEGKGEDPQDDDIEESYQSRQKEAIFTVDSIPPSRARHYQYADIQIPEIQEMLNNVARDVCNEKRGWLPGALIESIREIMTRIAQTNMLKVCKEKNMSLEEYKAIQEEKLDALKEESDSSSETSDEEPSLSDSAPSSFLVLDTPDTKYCP
jgi:general transcription factor 3C polypeptide 5 (transcription factor C subunit 1)